MIMSIETDESGMDNPNGLRNDMRIPMSIVAIIASDFSKEFIVCIYCSIKISSTCLLKNWDILIAKPTEGT